MKWTNLFILAAAELFAMSLWFSGSAVVPQWKQEWALTSGQASWMTMSVQIGFVLGALASAMTNLADRIPGPKLIAVSVLFGGLFNELIPVLDPGPSVTIGLRVLVGATLAGVYPPGMKVIASWCKEDRGLGVGFLIGALATGSALPHLLNALPGLDGMPPWRIVLHSTSAMALIASILAGFFVRSGPYLAQSAPFDWRFAVQPFAHAPTRMANFGYLGHMWELYAMWTWAPIFLLASYEAAGWSLGAARVAGFGIIAIGSVGSLLAGILADRYGRTTTAGASLLVSGLCCLAAGPLFGNPTALTALCLVWGFAVVADSAQFSAAVSELTDPRYVGTALTIQTSAGFLLTMVTIWVIPLVRDAWGWQWVFAVLALGPAFGIRAMWKLRNMPESKQMASGNR